MPEFSPQALASATAFRAIMMAMARPGQIAPLPGPAVASGLLPASLTILSTLCDYQTPVFLSPGLASPAAQEWIRFETGAAVTSRAQEAAFAVAGASEIASLMPMFAVGTHEYPDRSATVILQLPATGPAARVTLTGPGLAMPATLALPGLEAGFWASRAAVNATYPLGLDFIFVAEAGITACPRSTAAQLLEMA